MSVSTRPVGVMPRPDQPPAAVMHEFEGSSDEGGSERGAERPETQAAQRPTAFSGASPLTLSPSLPPSLLRGWLDHDAGGGVQRGAGEAVSR